MPVSLPNKRLEDICMAFKMPIWLFPSLTLLFVLPALGKPAPTPQQELQALYNKINAAAANKDVDGIYAYDDDDFVFIDKKGHAHDGSEGRQELEEDLDIMDSLKSVSKIVTFSGTDTEATVTVKDHAVATVANGVTGRAIKVTADTLSRDYWTYTADGWKRKRSRVLSETGKLHKNF